MKAKIPANYVRVKEGRVQAGDKVFMSGAKWRDAADYDVGCKVEHYICIIRPKEVK